LKIRETIRRFGWILAALASLPVIFFFYRQGIPVSTVPFDYSRAEIRQRMETVLEATGVSLEGYRSTLTFNASNTPKNYLHQVYGIAGLEEAERRGVNIWYWQGRWFKPGIKERFMVAMDPEGRLLAFAHTTDDSPPARRLSRKKALELAQRYLRANAPRHPWNRLQLVEESAAKKTNYSFTWERTDLREWEAPLQLWVGVEGDRVTGYVESFKVPETWEQAFARQRAVNQFGSRMAFSFLYGMAVWAAIFAIRASGRGELEWRKALPWGWFLLIGIVLALDQVHRLPESFSTYRTDQPWPAFLLDTLTSAAAEIGFMLLILWFAATVADQLYRKAMPGRLSFRQALRPSALGHPETTRALGVGIALALVGLAYVSLFYAIGQRFGVWVPVWESEAQPEGWIPWIKPLETGLLASFTEEMFNRVVVTFLLWKALKRRWLAVALSSVIWAFGHSLSPQMPGYIRGVELTFVGVFFCWVLFRYGIVSTLTAHYLYNCWSVGYPLLAASSLPIGSKVGAGAASLWPAALFVFSWWRGRHPAEVSAAPPVPVPRSLPPQSAAPTFSVLPVRLSRFQRGAALAVIAIGLLATGVVVAKSRKSREATLDLSRDRIKACADALLRERGVDPGSFKTSISIQPRKSAASDAYLLQHGSHERFRELCAREWGDVRWHVRYFRVLENEEFTVELDAGGRLRNFQHRIGENTPGARLDRAAALARSRLILARDYGVDFTGESLSSEESFAFPDRRDWKFSFNRKAFGWEAATMRTSWGLQGDEVVDFEREVIPPGDWTAGQEGRAQWRKVLMSAASLLTAVILLVSVVATVGGLVVRQAIPWRRAFRWAWVPAVLEMIRRLNSLPEFYDDYSTTDSFLFYAVTRAIVEMIVVAIAYLGSALCIGAVLGLMRSEKVSGFRWGDLWPQDREERTRFWYDVLLLSGALIALLGLPNLWKITSHQAILPEAAGLWPWWRVWTRTVKFGLLFPLIAGALISSWLMLRSRFPKLAATSLGCLLLFLPLPFALDGGRGERVLFSYLAGVGLLFLIAWLALKVWRFHPVVMFMVGAGLFLVVSIVRYLSAGGPVYQWQALPLMLIPPGMALVAWWCHRRTG